MSKSKPVLLKVTIALMLIALAALFAPPMPAVFTAHVQASCGSVAESDLYAGTSNPASVYRYDGTSWTLIGNFEEDFAVLCLVEFKCGLYAGTMSAFFDDDVDSIGRVYRYDGGTTWTLVGDGMDNQVACLVVYDGNLYAGTGTSAGRLYKYDGDTTWTLVLDIPWNVEPYRYGFRSAYVWGDVLYLGDWLHQELGHYDGTTFTHDAEMYFCEGIYDYEVYDEHLYACGGEGGTLHRSPDGTTWSTVWMYQPANNAWELETFGEYLYMGLGNGTLMRWDGSSLTDAWNTPDEQGIISMETSFDSDSMFLGVGGEAGAYWHSSKTGTGRVYSYDGSAFQLISGDMGTGVQVLYAIRSPLSHLEDLIEYIFGLYETGEIDLYKFSRIAGVLNMTLTDILNAMDYLDTLRHGFDDKVEGLYALKSAVSRLEHLVWDLQNWVNWGSMDPDLGDEIIKKLEAIIMALTRKAKCEAETERMLAVAALEDAEARSRHVPWLWAQLSYIDAYLADAEYWRAEGWLSKAVACYKMAFYYAQRIVVYAWHWSWGIAPDDWVDHLEATL